jgi:uncharacterized RDD family membrane protein YckC
MSARVEKATALSRAKTEEIIVDFSAEELAAPFALRCGALIVDYIIVVAIPVIGILLGRYMGNDGVKLLNSEINNTGWLIAVLIGLTNFVIFPMFSGQTIGKMLTGIRILSIDGRPVSFTKVLLRHLVGYPLTLLTGGLGFLFSVFNKKGRALHDYLSGTVVIYGRRRILK